MPENTIEEVISKYKAYKVSSWGSFTLFANPFFDRGINKANWFLCECENDFRKALIILLNEWRYISSCHKDSLISRLLYCAEFQTKVSTLSFNVKEKIDSRNGFADIIQALKDHIKSQADFDEPDDALGHRVDNPPPNNSKSAGGRPESESDRPTEVSKHACSPTS